MSSTRRVPLGVVLALGLVVLATLLWSAGWVFAARQAERLLADWRADQDARGRAFACAREARGGFPFRLEMRCERPQLIDRGGAGGPATGQVLGARAVRAVAQVYDLDHVIVEIDGPIEMAEAGGARLARIETGSVRASIQLAGGRIDRLSVVLPRTRVEVADSPAPVMVALAEGQLHTRRRPAEAALDLALSGRGMVFTGPIEDRLETIEVESLDLIAIVGKPVEGSLLEPVGLLRRWRQGGGVADITRLSFRSPALGADAKGSVHIAPDGTVEGALDAALIRLDAFLAILEERGAITSDEARLSAGAAQFFGRTSAEGEPRVTLPVRVRAGEVFIGPIRATRLPPLLEPTPDAG